MSNINHSMSIYFFTSLKVAPDRYLIYEKNYLDENLKNFYLLRKTIKYKTNSEEKHLENLRYM
jgi:hypothetical protein